METVPPRDRKGLRTGFTTGACAAAAAKAATRVLVGGAPLTEIESTLPNRSQVTFKLHRCDRTGERAICSIIKDAGDDPDCTHGAELVAEVELRDAPGIELRGGPGVATVTKPGLGLTVGDPAINPVPRRNITEMVEQELALGAQQDVGEHRHRALAIGDALREAQPAKELDSCDAKLHGASTFVRLLI